jgi:PAS domain S-box-containing protein
MLRDLPDRCHTEGLTTHRPHSASARWPGARGHNPTPVIGMPGAEHGGEAGGTAFHGEAMAWLRQAMDGAGLAIWELEFGRNGGSVACSPAHAALIGGDPMAAAPGALLCSPVPLDTCLAHVDPDDLPSVRRSLRDAARAMRSLEGAEEGPPFQLALRLLLPGADATRRRVWVEATGRFRRDAATGRTTRCTGVALDVTARREAEAARDHEVAVRHAFRDASPDALWVADAVTGRLENASRAFEAVLGIPSDAMLQHHPYPWPELLQPEDHHRVAGHLEAAREGRVVEVEYRVGDPAMGGGERWVRCTSFPLGAARPASRIGGILQDITARKASERALAESEARLRLAQEAAEMGVYERDLTTGRALWSPEMFRLWGLDPAGRSPWLSDAEYMGLILDDEREAHRARRDALRNSPEVSRFASEFRIRRADNGEVRWIASRGEYVRDAAGRAVLVRGTNHDVTDRKRAEERQTLLAREVDHRAKNALAVVQAVLKLTPRDDADAFARAVEGRVAALARVQTLLAEERWSGADLLALLGGELAPFQGVGQQVLLEGPPTALPPRLAQPLAMAAHELATNAVKHGALSVPEGRVCVSWQLGEGEVLRLRWEESGGPPLAGEPGRRGFGTRVLDGTVRRQLGGTVSLDWRRSGLVCLLGVPLRDRRAGRARPGNGRMRET